MRFVVSAEPRVVGVTVESDAAVAEARSFGNTPLDNQATDSTAARRAIDDHSGEVESRRAVGWPPRRRRYIRIEETDGPAVVLNNIESAPLHLRTNRLGVFVVGSRNILT